MKIPFLNYEINLAKPAPKGNTSNNGGSFLGGIIGQMGIRIAPQDLWKIYRINADVYSCVREWRQGVGAGGWQYVNAEDEEVAGDPRRIKEINQFWKNSGGMRKVDGMILQDLGISGNCFMEIVRNMNGGYWGLRRLDPRTISIVVDDHGTVKGYFQRVHGKDTIFFEPDEIWHIQLSADPDNIILGMSPLETAVWEARTDISASQSNYYFFENDAVPSSVYILDSKLSTEQMSKAHDSIKAQFSGAKNRNKSAVLAGVQEIKNISTSPKDMEFINGRKFNTDKITSVYGVPKFILGYTESVNYASGAKLMEKFYVGTIKPLETELEEAKEQLHERIGMAEIKIVYKPQDFGDKAESDRIALDEYKSGILTMRQYKAKTGQEITEEDESEAMIDSHIIHNGASAILMEDVGVDPRIDPDSSDDPT